MKMLFFMKLAYIDSCAVCDILQKYVYFSFFTHHSGLA